MAPLRRRAALFAVGVLLAAAGLPAINLARLGRLPQAPSALFDAGFAWPAISSVLRRAGVSTRPRQVVVGKAGWLFIGDQYAQAITDKRRAADANDRASADRQAAAARAWGDWLAAHGVAHWHVLVCADKDSVYPDLLPDWDRPAAGAAIDVAIERADPRVVVDTRPALRAARAVAGPALYLRTDSHWTARGAWIAYRRLAQAAAQPGFAWLQDADVRLRATRLPEGDLARLLDGRGAATDEAAAADFAVPRDARRSAADATSGDALVASVFGALEAPPQPVLLRSPQALNARRLLWLRDSFGAGLTPYVAATWAEVVEVDRDGTSPEQLAAFVQRFRPDDVLVTVVERNARADWFARMPP